MTLSCLREESQNPDAVNLTNIRDFTSILETALHGAKFAEGSTLL
jgi:hypothetical protein